ncbi:MAG: alpha/beta hydrolase [Rhodobacterales bacterium]|nr:MAG: alpha/beta hydrolase [Rhodobacterales bacterium]
MAVERLQGQAVNVARRGEGPPEWLMLHCTLARHEALLRLAGMLPGHVTLFDWPSHGRSEDPPEGRDLHDHCTAIAADLLEDGAHIVGHSFGATVALRLALEQQRVSALTLIEPVLFSAAVGAPGYIQHGGDYAPVEAAIAAGDTEAAARAFLDTWGMGVPWEAMPERLQREALRGFHYVPDSAPALHHDGPGLLAPGRLEALDIPVTLIAGAQSHPVIADIHAALAERLPNARSVVIEGAGHMVPITHPGEVGKAMGY